MQRRGRKYYNQSVEKQKLFVQQILKKFIEQFYPNLMSKNPLPTRRLAWGKRGDRCLLPMDR
jgi:hypothetical protein